MKRKGVVIICTPDSEPQPTLISLFRTEYQEPDYSHEAIMRIDEYLFQIMSYMKSFHDDIEGDSKEEKSKD